MRIKTKIAIGTGTILSIGIASMAIIYGGLSEVRQALGQFTDVKEPIHSATHEMEINVNGLALAVLKYRIEPSPQHLRDIEEDERDFEVFYARYSRLLGTQKEANLAREIRRLFEELKSVTGAVIAAIDEQTSAFSTVDARFEEMDAVMDDALSRRIRPGDPERLAKLEAVNALEADLAEVGLWLANYRRTHAEEYKDLIKANKREFLGSLERLRALGLTDGEREAAATLGATFARTITGVEALMASEGRLHRDLGRLVGLRDAIDELVDEELQILSRQSLHEPWRGAEVVTRRVLWRIGWLIPLFLLSAVGASAVLARSITAPVRQLMRGTRAIRDGDMDHRITPVSRDEFAELAGEFNRMAARLRETTVSKGLLQASEHQLRESVVSLRAEIAERRRVEAERLRLQAEVQASEVEWRSTFDAIDSPIIILDGEGRVSRMNRAASELAGPRGGTPAGRPVEALGSGQPWQAAGELMGAIRGDRAGATLQVRDENSGRHWDVAVGRIAGPELQEGRILIVAREITPLVELQASLRRAETMTVMGELVSGVAHQVRNPLFGISSVLDAMGVRFGGREDIGRYLTVLREQVERLGALMQELLEYGKPPGDGRHPGPIGEVIAEAARICGPLAARLGVRVECRIGPGIPPVKMDRTRLVRVFENLLENAIQHTPAGGEVAVESRAATAEGPGWIECAVCDTGPGFRAEELDRAFDPFFTRRHGGTGLGLSIVQRIVDEHGGRVFAGNRDEGGASLTVRLPASPPGSPS